MYNEIILSLTLIGLASMVCQWVAWHMKLPAILFLLMVGLTLGPVTGFLDPDRLFGQLLFPIVSLAVAIILFEGSLTLRFREIAGLEAVVRNMLTVGVAVTWFITALAVKIFLDFSWELASLFGAIMVVTGPTVIVPMLRSVKVNARIANILRWEGIVIDPLGAILAVLVFEFIISGQQNQQSISLNHSLIIFAETLFVGVGIGSLAGYGFGHILKRHRLPEYLHNVGALTLVLCVFSLTNEILDESGLLAVTVTGVWLANMKDVPVDDILDFKESLSVLLISGLFIILAARLDFSDFSELGFGAVMVLLIMQFFARPLKVLIATYSSNLSLQEKLMIGWLGPRGIVAAAVSALFAIRLESAGVEQASLLVPLAFAVIIGTVVIQSASAKKLAEHWGVAVPEDRGLLIIGANSVARNIAKALYANGFPSCLTDANWENIRAARMEGLQTYYGKAVSEHADRHLDLVGLGQMLALTRQHDLNTLSCLRYRSEFGSNHCFYLSDNKDKKQEESLSRKVNENVGYCLFGDGISFSKLASLLSQGAAIKTTKLSETFDYQAYLDTYGKRIIPLFAITPKNQLICFTANKTLTPQADWQVMALIQEEPENK